MSMSGQTAVVERQLRIADNKVMAVIRHLRHVRSRALRGGPSPGPVTDARPGGRATALKARRRHQDDRGTPDGHGARPRSSSEWVEWIADPQRFAAIATAWDQIAEGERTPFLMSSWIQAWYAAFAAPGGMLIVAVWRDNTLVGGLPLHTGWRRWDAAANDHTPEFGLLATDADARRRVVAEVLAQSNALNLAGLVGDGHTFTAVLETARRMGRWSLVEPGNVSLIAETTSSIEKYRAGLSSKVRSELGRLHRKSQREHELTITPLARPRDLERQLTQAFSLEASGWKGRAGTAITCAPQTERFYRQIAREFHAAGTLRMSELSLNGTLAAMAISIIHQQRLFTLKVGYDERHRPLGPGFVLLMAMIERCFELGLDAYEFSGPDAEYERRFATTHRAYRRLRVYRPGPVNAARYIFHEQARPALRLGYQIAQAIPLHASTPHPSPGQPTG
jgi:CelD/BcsL family acetyltransferase involved in cellulose biosynthesis